MRGPRALMASMTAFAASWRDSNCTVGADDRRKQKNYQDKDSGNQNRSIHGTHLTYHRGIRLGQQRSNGARLLLSCMKGSLRDPEVDLEPAIFPSRLGIAVLSHPPLMKNMPGVIAVVGVRRIRRQGQHRRCGVRGPTGPMERMKTVIHNKPIDESE